MDLRKLVLVAACLSLILLPFVFLPAARACDPDDDPSGFNCRIATRTPRLIGTEAPVPTSMFPSATPVSPTPTRVIPTATFTPTPTSTATPTFTPSMTPFGFRPEVSATPFLVATVTPTTPLPRPSASATATVSSTLTSLLSTVDPSLPLNCLLPDGAGSSNALGVGADCGILPAQIKVAKVATPAPVVRAATPTVVPNLPKGDSPFAAMPVTMAESWRTLNPGGVHWYKIENGNSFFMDVWMDTWGRNDLTFSLYSPEQTNGLNVNTPPKGRGAPTKFVPHDLFWSGAQAFGTWYALVRNYAAVALEYKITIKGATAERNCRTYLEDLPNGNKNVWWTACRNYP